MHVKVKHLYLSSIYKETDGLGVGVITSLSKKISIIYKRQCYARIST